MADRPFEVCPCGCGKSYTFMYDRAEQRMKKWLMPRPVMVQAEHHDLFRKPRERDGEE